MYYTSLGRRPKIGSSELIQLVGSSATNARNNLVFRPAKNSLLQQPPMKISSRRIATQDTPFARTSDNEAFILTRRRQVPRQDIPTHYFKGRPGQRTVRSVSGLRGGSRKHLLAADPCTTVKLELHHCNTDQLHHRQRSFKHHHDLRRRIISARTI